MISSIWVDSDSIPKSLRTIILRLGIRIDKPVYFVADRELADVKQFIAEDTHRVRTENEDKSLKSKISMVIVNTGENSADDYIVNNIDSGSFCITHDIPLASRLLEKNAFVIDDRGNTYTSDNIKAKLMDREVNSELRTWGVFAEQQKKQDRTSVKEFADNLDREINRLQK